MSCCFVLCVCAGGSIVASMDGYVEQLITMDEYDEDGPESVHRHNVLADDNAR